MQPKDVGDASNIPHSFNIRSVLWRSLYVWSSWYDRESNGWMLIPHEGPEKRVSQR